MRSLTVAICSYQRRQAITDQLLALNALAECHSESWTGVDVVVVLDGSTDGSAEALAELGSTLPLQVITQANTGLAGARNRCIDAARGEIIWFLDDDLVPLPGTLATHRAAHEGHYGIGLLGPCLLPDDPSIPAGARTWWDARHNELARLETVPVQHFSTANLSIDLSTIRSIGGFDQGFVGYGYEDNELGCRLMGVGVTTRFAPEAAVWHNTAIDDLTTFRRQRDLGHNLVLLVDRHPELGDLFTPTGRRFTQALFRCIPPAAYWPAAVAAYRIAARLTPQRPRTYALLRSVAWDGAFASGSVDQRRSLSTIHSSSAARTRFGPRNPLRSPRVFIAPIGSSPVVAQIYHLLRRSWAATLHPVRQHQFQRRALRPAAVGSTPKPQRTGGSPCVFLSVYRYANASVTSSLLSAADDLDLDVRLWALDRVHPSLSEFTVGTGPGGKYDLLNRMRELRPARAGAWWVIADDDVLLAADVHVRDLLEVMDRAGLDVAQPAHTWWSAATYWLTYRRPWLEARRTGFVEIGPLLGIAPDAALKILPFPSHHGMGWSIQADWYLLGQDELRFGIVDRVAMTHRDLPNHSYDWVSEHRHFVDRLAELDLRADEYEMSLLRSHTLRRRFPLPSAFHRSAARGS